MKLLSVSQPQLNTLVSQGGQECSVSKQPTASNVCSHIEHCHQGRFPLGRIFHVKR